jgi:hypothetical protein
MVRSQPWQIVPKTLSQKILHKSRAGGVAQSEGPKFNPTATHTHTHKNPKTKTDKQQHTKNKNTCLASVRT